jgi:hypothetical protein
MNASKLLIGWSTSDVTPTKKCSLRGQFYVRISQGIKDPLTTTVLALESENGDSQAIIVSLDSLAISEALLIGCRKKIQKLLPDFETANLIINATHSHTTPGQMDTFFSDGELEEDILSEQEYTDFLINKISEAAEEAWNKRKSGAISYGCSYAAIGFNRRMAYFDGKSLMYGNNDDPRFSHVEGHEDHGVNMLFTYNSQKQLTGMIINVACPSQCTEGASFISADFWHETRREIRKRHGQDIHVLAQCSAAGDQAPRNMINRRADERMLKLKAYESDGKYGSAYDEMRRQDIADKIACVVDELLPLLVNDIKTKVKFEQKVLNIDIECYDIQKAEFEEAQRTVASWKEKLDACKGCPASSHDHSLAYKKVNFFKSIIDRYENQQQSINTIPVELHCIRLDEIAFATNPFEYFLDFGVRIKTRSKALQTFLVQLVGRGTYLPTQRAVDGGGYSAFAGSALASPTGGQTIVEAEISAINEMFLELN